MDPSALVIGLESQRITWPSVYEKERSPQMPEGQVWICCRDVMHN